MDETWVSFPVAGGGARDPIYLGEGVPDSMSSSQ